MNKFIPVGHSTNSVAETFVAVICSQVSNIPFFFSNCDRFLRNKSHEKKLQVKINSFIKCHMESLIVKAT